MPDPTALRFTPLQRTLAALLDGPPAVLRRLAGPPVFNDEGWQLDLPTQVLASIEQRTDLRAAPTDDARKLRSQSNRIMPLGMPKATDVSVTQRRIPGPAGSLVVRVYQRLSGETDRPAVVYFHGGGWVVGNLDTHDGSCRYIASRAGCVVISVDYRLAPEHPFPAAPEDAIAAYAWTLEHADELALDPARIGVMGDSAGGTLSVVVAQQAPLRDLPTPKVQCLVYPSTDITFASDSHREFAAGFVLSRRSMEYFRSAYAPDESTWTDTRVAPCLATHLEGLAPGLIYTAGFDPLRDEARDYAAALSAAGVPVTERCYHDRIHGFFGMGIFPGALSIIDEICRDLREALAA